jgi:glycosyltransferase involved in cell wall biosynthesis
MARLIFVNRYFSPDHSATSQILSDLAFHLAQDDWDVHVVSGDTLYGDPSKRLPSEEALGRVQVHRVPGGKFGRSSLAGRAIDYLRLYVALRRRVRRLLSPGDVLIAKTDPPLLSIALAGLAARRGARYVAWLQDLYPEVAGALDVPFVEGRVEEALARARDRSLASADAIVAIGARMKERLTNRGLRDDRIHVIPNWSDDEDIKPVPPDQNPLRAEWGLSDKFVLGYSGNLGRAHEYETLLAAAERLKGRSSLIFLFIGGGHYVDQLREDARTRGLEALFQFRPYQDRSRLSQSLSVPDVHWLSLRTDLEGLIVPSKLYGIAAAGRPVINVGAPDGEVAQMVHAHRCGLTVTPGDGHAMAAAIERFLDHPELGHAMGRRARDMLQNEYTRARAFERWKHVLKDVAAGQAHTSDDQ